MNAVVPGHEDLEREHRRQESGVPLFLEIPDLDLMEDPERAPSKVPIQERGVFIVEPEAEDSNDVRW